MTAPDLSDYRIIHGALRIAPHRLASALTSFNGSREQARALDRYWRGYAGEVLAHHTIEDEVLFPRLVERFPVAEQHLARVDGEHHRLDELMAAAGAAFERVGGTAATGAADDAADVVRELAALMDSHLDFEDEHLVPRFGDHFDAQEYEALHKEAIKVLGFGKQAAFTVPFIAHWTAPADMELLMADAPLAFRLLHRAVRRSHARLTTTALGAAAARDAVLPDQAS